MVLTEAAVIDTKLLLFLLFILHPSTASNVPAAAEIPECLPAIPCWIVRRAYLPVTLGQMLLRP